MYLKAERGEELEFKEQTKKISRFDAIESIDIQDKTKKPQQIPKNIGESRRKKKVAKLFSKKQGGLFGNAIVSMLKS